MSEAYESKLDAQNLYNEMSKEEFRPFTRELDYNVNINKNGLLSITDTKYCNNNGAHGS